MPFHNDVMPEATRQFRMIAENRAKATIEGTHQVRSMFGAEMPQMGKYKPR